MSDEQRISDRLERVRAVMRDWETYPTPDDPDFARIYAGQWVVMYQGRVVAHGRVGSEIAKLAPVQNYPGAEIFYVPTLEQQEGVWVLQVGQPDN
jgi:hypothetical protein